jgi:hypothetical protein
MPLQIRRGTELQRTSMTQPLAAGELLFVTSPTNRIYVGDGTTLGGIAVTGYTNEDAQDAVAPMFVGGTHSGINFVYNDASNIINAMVDLSNYNGTIRASSFKGTLVADDSTALVDAVDGRIFLDGTVKGNIVPNADVAYDLGSATYRFRDLYLSGSSIKLGAATITATGTAVNLPAGSTIGGSAIGIPGGDLNVNIVADDSTVIVNTTTEVVTAQGGFVGDVKGSVFGDDSSVIVNAIDRIVTAAGGFVGNVTGNTSGVHFGNVTGNVTGNVIGDVIGNSSGYHTGDVKGSVFGDDSTILVDAVSGTLRTSSIVLSGSNITASQLNIGTVASPLTSLYINSQDTQIPVRLYGQIGTFAGSFQGPFTARLGYRGTLTVPQTIQDGDFISGDVSSAYVGNEGIGGTGYAFVGVQGFGHETGTPISSTSNFLKGFWYVSLSDGTTVDFDKSATFRPNGALGAPILAAYPKTTTEVNAITPEDGMIVFDTTTNQFKGYNGSAWVVLG